MSMTWTLEVPMATPSANVMLRNHWAKNRKLQELWRLHLQAAGAYSIPEATTRRKVKVTRYSPGTPDYANIWAGVDKVCLDNLKKLGVIVDDNPTWLEIEVKSAKGEARTVIEITDESIKDVGRRVKNNGDPELVQ